MEEKRSWLESLGDSCSYTVKQCKNFLKENPDISEDNLIVQGLRDLNIREKIKARAILEKKRDYWARQSYCDIEASYARGAVQAFDAGDYTNPLIHRYIDAQKLEKVL